MANVEMRMAVVLMPETRGRLKIAAAGINTPSVNRFGQNECTDDDNDYKKDGQHRDACDEEGSDRLVNSFADAGDRFAVGGEQSQTANCRHRAECHNKRGPSPMATPMPFTMPTARPASIATTKAHDQRRVALAEQRGQNASGECNGGADRHIKAACDDDEHHAERQNAVDGSLFEDVHEVGRCDEAGLPGR